MDADRDFDISELKRILLSSSFCEGEGRRRAFFVKFMLDIIDFTLNAMIETGLAVNEPVNEPVNSIARRIHGELALNGNLTCDELAVILSVSRSTVMRNIRILKDAGLIHRAGSDKTGRWEAAAGNHKAQ